MSVAASRTSVLPSGNSSTKGAMGASDLRAGAAHSGETSDGDVFPALARWQRYLKVSGRCNLNTRQQYRRAVFAFLADLFSSEDWDRPISLWAITEDDVAAYLDAIDEHSGMRNQLLKALRSLYGYLAHDDLRLSPVRHLTPRKPKVRRKPALSVEQTEAVLAAAAELRDPRARWAIQLQLMTGCRVGSLLAVAPDDLLDRPRGRTVYFAEAKNDKPYEVPLGPRGREAADHLLELIDYRPLRVPTRLPTLVGVGYQAYRQWVEKVARRSGVPLRSHLFRHTAITRWVEDPETDPRTVMEFANWEDLSQYRGYAQASDPNMRRLAERHG
jgi:integrase